MTLPSRCNEITSKVIGCAIEIHRTLGPGLLESAYQACLAHELRAAGISFESQRTFPIVYKGLALERGYRLDFVIEDVVIVEIKSLGLLAPIHEAQLLTYLKLTGIPLGLLLNFNVTVLKNGIKRMINTV